MLTRDRNSTVCDVVIAGSREGCLFSDNVLLLLLLCGEGLVQRVYMSLLSKQDSVLHRYFYDDADAVLCRCTSTTCTSNV